MTIIDKDAIPHGNDGWPKGLTPESWVKCWMADGTQIVAAQAKDIDWTHETDPVVAYMVTKFVPLVLQ